MKHGTKTSIVEDTETGDGVVYWAVCVWRDGNSHWHGPFDTEDAAAAYRKEVRR